jgi:hypothetical protein
MTKQLLFYERAVPVSAQRHGDWALEPSTGYGFAAQAASVPLAAVEFAPAAMEYAIVFTGKEGAAQPTAVLGLKAGENLYVDGAGQWRARYVPAFVRRYPFVFSKSGDGSRFVLCIDEEHAGWNREGRGERLFAADGGRTAYLERMLKFVRDYQQQFERTLAFCRRLWDLGLLEPMTARFEHPSGKKASLTGFLAVDREKLNALPGETLSALAKSGALEMVYVHLHSLRNLSGMLGRAAAGPGGGEAAVPDDQVLH